MIPILKNLFKKEKNNNNQLCLPIDNCCWIEDIERHYEYISYKSKKTNLIFRIISFPFFLFYFIVGCSIVVLLGGVKAFNFKQIESKELSLQIVFQYLNNLDNQKHIINSIKQNNYLTSNQTNYFVSNFTDFFQQNNIINEFNLILFFKILDPYRTLYHTQKDSTEVLKNFSEEWNEFLDSKEKNCI